MLSMWEALGSSPSTAKKMKVPMRRVTHEARTAKEQDCKQASFPSKRRFGHGYTFAVLSLLISCVIWRELLVRSSFLITEKENRTRPGGQGIHTTPTLPCPAESQAGFATQWVRLHPVVADTLSQHAPGESIACCFAQHSCFTNLPFLPQALHRLSYLSVRGKWLK